MRFLQIGVVGAILSLGAVNTVSAYSLSPTQTKFTLTGPAGILIGIQFQMCTITMTGMIPRKAKNSMIESVSVTGQNCASFVGANLPWALRAKTATTAQISSCGYTDSDNVCGPYTIHPTVNSNGVWTMHAKSEGTGGVCNFSASLTSTPPITIVP